MCLYLLKPHSYPPSVLSLFPEKKQEDNYFYNPLASEDNEEKTVHAIPVNKQGSYGQIPKEEFPAVQKEKPYSHIPKEQPILVEENVIPVEETAHSIPVNKQGSYGQIPKEENVYRQSSYGSIPKAPISFDSFMEVFNICNDVGVDKYV